MKLWAGNYSRNLVWDFLGGILDRNVWNTHWDIQHRLPTRVTIWYKKWLNHVSILQIIFWMQFFWMNPLMLYNMKWNETIHCILISSRVKPARSLYLITMTTSKIWGISLFMDNILHQLGIMCLIHGFLKELRACLRRWFIFKTMHMMQLFFNWRHWR